MDRNQICCATRGDPTTPDIPCPHSPDGTIAHRYRTDSTSRPPEVALLSPAQVEGRVIRFDVDDPLAKVQRELEERLATQWCRTDAEREAAIEVLAHRREHAAWLEAFARERRENERHDSSSDEDESVRRLEWRLNNQFRPNFDPAGYERERRKP